MRQFGTYHPATEKYAFDSLHTSLLSSLAFIGKFLGCLGAGPAIEKFGHRVVFVGLSIISFIGIISKSEVLPWPSGSSGLIYSCAVEITAADSGPGSGRYAQFVIGRIIVYISVGLVEVDVT